MECFIDGVGFQMIFRPLLNQQFDLTNTKLDFTTEKNKLTHQKVLNLIQFGGAIIFNHTNIAMDQW